MRLTIPVFLFALPLVAASGPSLLPLETGNHWTYRDDANGETRTITVGLPLMLTDGRMYYHVRGYVDQPVWVREAPGGSLFYLDEESGEDRILTSFEQVDGGWAEAPFRPCPSQESQVARERRGRALELEYRVSGCADVGTVRELYEENIGMTRRTETRIDGEHTFRLESARIGALVYAPSGTGRFHVEVTGMGDHLRVVLRLIPRQGATVPLRFASGQRFEIVIRNLEGDVLWRWSDGRFFTQAMEEIHVSGEFVIEETVMLEDVFGAVLPEGEYVVEGSLLGGAYAATSTFSIVRFF